MQTKHYTILTFLLFLATFETFAQSNSLTVLDPRRGNWTSRQGTIEEATFVVRPKGIYLQVDMYLTFSAKQTFFSPNDTLEVVLNFNLPSQSIVHDSWLWIDDQIIKADILDRWTASNIYEDIVGRRQDPSILFKNGENNYQLRIFPLPANKSRKVKISYLTPMNWSNTQVTAPLPLDILRTSAHPTATQIRTWLDGEWRNPVILGNSDAEFQLMNDPDLGDYYLAVLSNHDIQNSLSFATDSPMKNNIYLSKFDQDGEKGIYQLVFFPSEMIDNQKIRSEKIVVLFDYTPNAGSDFSKADIVNQVSQQLSQTLSGRDSFNIVYAQLNTKTFSNTWMQADSQTVVETFDDFGTGQIPDYTNLPALLGEAIDFIKENGGEGKIMIVANTYQIQDINSANQLIHNLQDAIDDDNISFFIYDFANPQAIGWNWFGGQYYIGNEYFYLNLARLTTGDFITAYNRDFNNYNFNFKNNISEFFDAATALDGFIDLHTKLESGFCHSRYNVGNQGNVINFRKPFMQVGKYEGNFPFIIETAGTFEGSSFSKRFVINENTAFTSDTLAQEVWTGNYIQTLEKSSSANSVIAEVIRESIEERVLSNYTAFICLEEQRGGYVCTNCNDESGGPTVDTDNVPLDSLINIIISPNPFSDRVTITLAFEENTSLDDYSFAIYNMMGQQVKVFNDIPNTATDRLELTWDARDASGQNVAAGVYFFVIQTPQGRQSFKLMKL